VLSAVVNQGHTVVPYRLRQEGATRGWIDIYDPNHPEDIDADQPRQIEFDLSRNRYSFGTMVSIGQKNVGIVAVGQRAYMGRGTAFLATLGSLLLSPRRGLRSLRQAREDARA
jgi:hypothetical protein